MRRRLTLFKKLLETPHQIPPYMIYRLEKYGLLKNEWLYRPSLLEKGASMSPKYPNLADCNEGCELKTLKKERSYQTSANEVQLLGLHPHLDAPKNWDSLYALKKILSNTESYERILDAGGAKYSPLVEWLYLYGYDDLFVQNIDFDNQFKRGPILYQVNDFTDTGFKPNSIAVIVCLSVIEHGVPIKDALEEFYRVLRKDGLLIISTDYWPEKIYTNDIETEFGDSKQQWQIFSENEIKDMLKKAKEIGFKVPEKKQFVAEERTIALNDEAYTFIYFELRKQHI